LNKNNYKKINSFIGIICIKIIAFFAKHQNQDEYRLKRLKNQP